MSRNGRVELFSLSLVNSVWGCKLLVRSNSSCRQVGFVYYREDIIDMAFPDFGRVVCRCDSCCFSRSCKSSICLAESRVLSANLLSCSRRSFLMRRAWLMGMVV